MATYYNKPPIQAFKENEYPNLYLDFGSNKSLKDNITKREDIVTFSRASEGTYFDSDGILKRSQAIDPVNFLSFSEEFDNVNWVKSGATISPNQAIAPDGTLTADKLIGTSAEGVFNNRVYQLGASISLKTVSIYAKAAEAEQIWIRYNNDNSSLNWLKFSLIDGSLLASGSNEYTSYTAQDVGNGWWRFSVTSNPVVQSLAYFAVAGPGNLSGQGIYIWGAQLETATSVSEYSKTESSTIFYEPRFDHDPATGESLGLLIEHSAIKIKGGETSGLRFPQGSWGAGTGISTDITAPDGTSQTYKIVSLNVTSSTPQRTIDFAYFNFSVTSGSYYVCSFYVYATGETPQSRTFKGIGGGADIDTNLPPELVHFGIIEDNTFKQKQIANYRPFTFPKNKWVRYAVTIRAQSTCSSGRLGYQVGMASNSIYDFQGYNASIYIWGIQVEEIAANKGTGTPYSPTSYIYGASGTRAQDFVTIQGSNFTNIYNPNEFSVFSEFKSKMEYPTYSSVPEIDKFVTVYGIGVAGDRSAAVAESGSTLLAYKGFSEISLGTTNLYNYNKVVNVYNSSSLSFSGSLDWYGRKTNTFASAAPSQTSMTIGRLDGYSDTNLCGHLKKFAYWPTTLSSGSLETITKQGLEGLYVTYPNAIVTDGLVANLDAGNPASYSGTGTTWTDLTGNGNNGTIFGSPVFTSSPGYFDITSDSTYIRMNNANLKPRLSDFTYSCWIKYDSFPTFFTVFENGSYPDSLLFRYERNNGFLSIYSESVFRGIFAQFNFINIWYNIVLKRENGICTVFINNNKVGDEVIVNIDINISNPYIFLMRSQYTTNQFTDGKISTFSIYNRALSGKEIEQNFNALRGRYGI